jgi:hypothetical protein
MELVVVPLTERQALVLRRVADVVAGNKVSWLSPADRVRLRAAGEALARAVWGPCNHRHGRGMRVTQR